MNPSQAEAVYRGIAAEIRAVREEDISRRMLEVTKEQMISSFMIGSESTLNRMTSAGAALLLRGEVQEIEEVMEQIEQVQKKDLAEVMDLIFSSGVFSYSAVGNLQGVDFTNTIEKFFS